MAQSSRSPSKKRRIHPQPLTFIANDEQSEEIPALSLYFDTLNENEICNVVRFLSESPRAENWRNCIDLSDILGLYEAEGKLGTFMLTLCTALRLSSRNISFYGLFRGETEEAIRCEPESLLHLSLPERVAESFCTLFVRYDVPDELDEYVADEIVDCISENFPNIRELHLDVGLTEGDWIRELGQRIESLYCDDFLMDVAKCCPNLRHLYLYDIVGHKYDVKSWEKSLENLETFCVLRATQSIDVIEFVEKFCRKIKRLELDGGGDEVQEALSKCISSYGNQLERVRLHSMTESQLLRIKSACPNARIELIIYEELLAQSVKIIGCELVKVAVYPIDDSQENHECLVDWSACINIEKWDLCRVTVSVADIERFMKSPKYRLRSILLSIHGELKKVRAAISLIAKGTGGLEEFDLTCDDAALGTFKELVDQNQLIRKVKISLHNPVRENEVATDIVKTFLKSPSLRNLKVNGRHGVAKIPEIEITCRAEGCRQVCISVFGVSYLR